MSSDQPTPAETDRLATLRAYRGILDTLRNRADQRRSFKDPWFQAWQELRAETLGAIGIEERRAQAEAAGETGGIGP